VFFSGFNLLLLVFVQSSVEMILDLLSAGMTFDEVLADYPDLEGKDLQACLKK
jgi:uncharacterized protein (DUF433 family)